MRRKKDIDYGLERELVDAFGALIKHAGTIAQGMCPAFGLNPSDLLALYKLDDGLSMKELAGRLDCDASFVTAVTDALEKRGLVRREPSQRDRRVKNLRLTPEGADAKQRLTDELAAQMPWNSRLDSKERRCFLSLLRKMVTDPTPSAGGDSVTPAISTSS
jgi:DNA-binding MarR family transcriptional regulator